MEKVSILGKMEESMKENINMIRNMDMVYIYGLMEEVNFII
jgi:hypothetical protein